MLESYLERPASVIFFAIYIIITVYFISNMLLAVVYSSFSDAAMTKFKNLYLHKRKALKLAYSILAQQNGIDFHDFQKFMKYYRPTLAGCEAMCTFKALHRDPEDTEQHRPLSREEFYRFYEVLDLTWIQVHENQLHWYKQVDLLVVKTCQTPIKVCHTIVKSKVFKFIIYLTVLTNILVLVIYTLAVDGGPSDERFQALQRIYPLSFIFTLIYCVEIILKIIGKGPHNYYRKVWNIIDSVLVFASLLLILLEANSNLIFLAAARPFKLFRLLRLNHRYYDLLWTLVYLAPKMVTIGIFLVLVYYVYAIVGVEFLNGRVFEGCCNDSWYNIRVFYTGIIDEGNTTENVSPSVDIYYLLNFDDIARSYITLFTLMIGNNWHVIMEGFSSESRFDWLVRLYFLSFNIMTLVIFEVAIAFLVEAFVYKVLSRQRHRICRKHKGPFKHCQCPEGDDQRKKVKISLVQADLDAMKQEKERNNLSTAASKLVSSLRRQRNHEHHTHPKSFVGHRLKTKGDIQLEMYRSQLNEWVQEAEELELALAERRRKASAKVPWRTLMANHLEKMYEYLTE